MNDQNRPAPPGGPAELSAGQVDALRALLESELRAALGAARESGVPRTAIHATISHRGRALDASAHDRQDPLDQAGQGDGVAEQG